MVNKLYKLKYILEYMEKRILIFFGVFVFFIFALIGSLYFPMALLAAAVHDSVLIPLNFPFILSSIWQIKKHYFLSLLTMWIFAFIGGIVHTIVSSIPFLGFLLFWIVALYFGIVQMHILGNIYFIDKNSLKWLWTLSDNSKVLYK